MKIVADDKIPYIEPCLRALTDDVVMKPGQDITADDVRNAHILVVRTRTRCDASLLSGSSVFLVATATIGYDHLDTRWLEEHGIAWANCPGCNASSVGQYVNSSLLQLQRQRGVDLKASTLGIVGVGHVGTAVLRSVTEGLPGAPLDLRRILLCDPPRQQAGDTPPEGYEWCSLERIKEETLGERAPHQRGTPPPGLHRHPAHRRLQRRRQGQCHPDDTAPHLPFLLPPHGLRHPAPVASCRFPSL